ncbi:MAG: hypothetical protein CM15mP45_03970 [Deltaproteobacteria bacterium]|nr:MAG: hypothetical protein CM15mP45_03970 [Deltaproteobacteria bacterium]
MKINRMQLSLPGGHGAMLGIPSPNVKVLGAKEKDLYTTLCHGPGALLSTNLDENPFLSKKKK